MMLSSALGTKDGQSPLGFLLLPLDLQGIQLHGKNLPHLTLEIFHLICKFVLHKVLLPTFLLVAIFSRGMFSSPSSLELLQICITIHLRVL